MKKTIIGIVGICIIPSALAFTPLVLAGAGAGGVGILAVIAYLIARRNTKTGKVSAAASRMGDHTRRSRHLSNAAVKSAQTAAVDPRQRASLAQTLQAQLHHHAQMAGLFEGVSNSAREIFSRNPQLRERYRAQIAVLEEGRKRIIEEQRMIHEAQTALSRNEFPKCQGLLKRLESSWLARNRGRIESAYRDISSMQR